MITIHQGSILDADVDYIVNPANSFLQHGGGLARVIADAATYQYHPLVHSTTASVAELYASRKAHIARVNQWIMDHQDAPLIATGNVHLTSPGVLPFDGVIHAVGPIWNGGDYCEAVLLEIVHNNIFQLAEDRFAEVGGPRRIALPAISTGVFGFPIKNAARIAIAEALWYAAALDIQFWLFSDEHREVFARELDRQLAGTIYDGTR